MGTNIPPDFWVALMDVLKAAATLSAAAFVSWAAVKLKDVRAGLHRVEHQVKNHHQTNLRDDIDRNQAATRSHTVSKSPADMRGLHSRVIDCALPLLLPFAQAALA